MIKEISLTCVHSCMYMQTTLYHAATTHRKHRGKHTKVHTVVYSAYQKVTTAVFPRQ